MRTRRMYTPIDDSVVWSVEEVEDALVNWGRAEGTRLLKAVILLLVESRIAREWDDFQFSISRDTYIDPDEPETKYAVYPVARILDWGRLHNDIPFDSVGKEAFGIFVWARMLADRSFLWSTHDALVWMPDELTDTVLKALAVYRGHSSFEAWADKHADRQ